MGQVTGVQDLAVVTVPNRTPLGTGTGAADLLRPPLGLERQMVRLWLNLL
jgi:hypothetical protein